MGAGSLGRCPRLGVKYLVDVEGPSESFVTCFEPWALDEDPENDRHEQAYAMFGHYSTYRDPSPENIAWWTQREATRYIDSIRCRYLRIQAQWDHAQPPNAQWPGFDYPPLWYPCKHGVDLINLATLGWAAWTRMNGSSIGNPPDTTYSRESPPIYYAQSFHTHPDELPRVIQEMAAMPALELEPGDYEPDGDVDLADYVQFSVCLTGPDGGPLLAGCRIFDSDCDDDVDLADAADLQSNFTGS
jgi:hypothetical protein